jgi:hypothetical protein
MVRPRNFVTPPTVVVSTRALNQSLLLKQSILILLLYYRYVNFVQILSKNCLFTLGHSNLTSHMDFSQPLDLPHWIFFLLSMYMNCPLKNHKGGTPLLTLPRFNSFYFYLSSISHIIPCTDLLNNYNPFCNNLLHNLSFPLHIQLSIQTSKS